MGFAGVEVAFPWCLGAMRVEVSDESWDQGSGGTEVDLPAIFDAFSI